MTHASGAHRLIWSEHFLPFRIPLPLAAIIFLNFHDGPLLIAHVNAFTVFGSERSVVLGVIWIGPQAMWILVKAIVGTGHISQAILAPSACLNSYISLLIEEKAFGGLNLCIAQEEEEVLHWIRQLRVFGFTIFVHVNVEVLEHAAVGIWAAIFDGIFIVFDLILGNLFVVVKEFRRIVSLLEFAGR